MGVMPIEKPDKTLYVGDWIIQIYRETHTAICFRSGSKICYIVRETTDNIVHLPKYVVKALRKEGFLEEWKAVKVKQIISRLNEICEKLEKMEMRT